MNNVTLKWFNQQYNTLFKYYFTHFFNIYLGAILHYTRTIL